MKRIVDDFSTEVQLTEGEASSICRLGRGNECCAFLTLGANGYRCLRMDYPLNMSIFDRLEKGTMNAKGKGGWTGCAWEKELAEEDGGSPDGE